MSYTIERAADEKADGRIEPPLTISREEPSNAEAVRQLQENAMLRAVRSDTSRYLPDILMGGVQAVGALGELSARAGGENQLTAPLIKKLTGLTPQEAAAQGNQNVLDLYNQYFPTEPGDPGPAVRRGIGQAAVTAPFVPAAGGAGLVANTLKGTGVGAAGAALTPVYGATSDQDYWSKLGGQTKEGAKWGAAFGLGGTVAGRAMSPQSVDPGIRMLQEAKIRLTPGQAGGSVTKGIEDRLQSADLFGVLKSRRFEGVTDFNRAIYAKALEPFGEEGASLAAKTDVGYKGVAKVGDYLSAKYEAALDASVPVAAANLRASLNDLAAMVPVAKRQDFIDTLEHELYSKITPAGTITPSVAKRATSALGNKAATYRSSSDADHREFSLALREAQSELREAFAVANPETAPMIRAADKGWATLVQMERASAMLGAKDGIFTPSQLLNAIRRGDTSIRKRSWRKDEGNYPLAAAAENILPSKVPDSGTPTRALLAYIGSEVAAGGGGLPLGPTALVTAASLPYLPRVSPALSKVITARPEALVSLGDLLRGQAPLLALPGLGLTGSSPTQSQ